VYNILPNTQKWAMPFASYDWYWGDARSANVLRFTADEYANGYSQWAADAIVEAGSRSGKVWSAPYAVYEFLYYNNNIPPKSPHDLPLTREFEDLEGVIWRTGWDHDDLVFGFKTGAYGGRFAYDTFMNGEYPWEPPCKLNFCSLNVGHDHDDTNTFYIHRAGEYLASETVKYGGQSTSLHNTLLIDGKGQFNPLVYDSMPDDAPPSDGFMEATAITENVNYVAGDATNRYNHISGISDVTRHVVFVRPDYFIILDNIESSSSHTYEWVSHFGSSVSVEGSWIRGNADGGQILGVKPIAPSSFATSTGNDGTPYVRIRPTSSMSDARLINLLYPSSTSTWHTRPDTSLLADNGSAAGMIVSHKDGSGLHDVVLVTYAAQPGDTDVNGYQYDGQMALVSYNSDSTLARVFLYGGSYINISGNPLISGVDANEAIEATYEGNGAIVVSGKANDSIRLYAPNTQSLTVNGTPAGFTQDGDYIIFSADASTDGVTGTLYATPAVEVSETVEIRLNDPDLNTDSGQVESTVIAVTSSRGETENVTLTESNASTGIFEGTVDTTPGTDPGTDNDGVFVVQANDVLTATYEDAMTSTGNPGTITTTTEILADPYETIESDDTRVSREGSWSSQSTNEASGGSYLYGDGGALTLVFGGTSIEVIYIQEPNLGSFAIEVDGTVLRTVDASGETTYNISSTIDYLQDDVHILRVYPVSGTVALDAFKVKQSSDAAPGVINLIEPSGTIIDSNPSFKWEKVARAEWYFLAVSSPAGSLHKQWYHSDQVCTASTCKVDSIVSLESGDYTWQVVAQNVAGYTISTPLAFSVSAANATITQIAPSGTVNSNDGLLEFKWERSDVYEWYHIAVADSDNQLMFDEWFSHEECELQTCSVVPETALEPGNYDWYIQGHDGNKHGDWYGPLGFSIDSLVPGVISKQSPQAGSTLNSVDVQFSWQADANASGYHIYLLGPAGSSPEGMISGDVGDEISCNNGVCSRNVTLSANGEWTWYLAGYNVAGTGPWSANNDASDNWGAVTFNVDQPSVGAITKVAPAEGATITGDMVSFSWKADNRATSYETYVTDSKAEFIDYQDWNASEVCSGNTCTVDILLPANGAYTWYLRGVDALGGGPWSASNDASDNWGAVTFNLNVSGVGTVHKTNPDPDETFNQAAVSFSWHTDPKATQYELYIAGPDGFALHTKYTVGEDITCGSSCTIIIMLPVNGEYVWYLRGTNAAGAGPWSASNDASDNWGGVTFYVDVSSVDVVEKTAPEQNDVVDSIHIDFSWKADPNATYYETYLLDVDGSFTDYQAWDASKHCDNNACSTTITVPHNGVFTWYLRGGNAAGDGKWSAANDESDSWGGVSFSVDAAAPQPYPNLISPADGEVVVNQTTSVSFEWESVANATWYALVIADANTGTEIATSWYSSAELDCIQGENCQVSVIIADGRYRWAVMTWGPAMGPNDVPTYEYGKVPTNIFEKIRQ
jgi:hypothetical protein